MNNTSLTQKLSKHFQMHPSRLKTFAAAILGAMSSGNCQQYSLSRMLESPTCKSGIRRIERLFQKQELTCSSLALFLVEELDFIGLFDLCLDRSNWEFGAYSNPNRAAIPIQTEQRFQSKPSSDSNPNRAVIPI